MMSSISSDDERTPLLHKRQRKLEPSSGALCVTNADVHTQFCFLIGMPPSNAPADPKAYWPKSSLYNRATRQLSSQTRTYLFTAVLTNTLLLSQVVLGAVVTGLGATESSHLIITIIGALNTIIAGLVAYLKSRGQPMRARMYKDDLERVVDEIENSEVMWLGISQNIQGYDEVDDDGDVTVRSEVARLTRLYDRAVRNNNQNNPDMYVAGPGIDSVGGGKRGITVSAPDPVVIAAPIPAAPAAVVPAPSPPSKDPDASPASAPPKRAETPKPAEPPASQAAAPPPTQAKVPGLEPVPAPGSAPPSENAPGLVALDDDDNEAPATRKEDDGKAIDQHKERKEEPAVAGANPSSAVPADTTPSAAPVPAPTPTPQPQQPPPPTIHITPSRDPDQSPATAPPRKRSDAAPREGGKENTKA